jgi:ATP-binding cassette subfamily B protein
LVKKLLGGIAFKNVVLSFGEKTALKGVSFSIAPGTRTAIVGPTAAGKTQLLYLMAGLLRPTSGSVEFDGVPLEEFDRESFHSQLGLVFQDSIVFHLSLRENIAFSNTVTDSSIAKAIDTAELRDFLDSLPE